jgi:hypothetical protein
MENDNAMKIIECFSGLYDDLGKLYNDLCNETNIKTVDNKANKKSGHKCEIVEQKISWDYYFEYNDLVMGFRIETGGNFPMKFLYGCFKPVDDSVREPYNGTWLGEIEPVNNGEPWIESQKQNEDSSITIVTKKWSEKEEYVQNYSVYYQKAKIKIKEIFDIDNHQKAKEVIAELKSMKLD